MSTTSVDLSEEARIRELHSYQILGTAPEQAYDSITSLAQDLFQVPVALVSLVDASRQWFKSRQGLDISETPRSFSFCRHAIEQPGVLMVVTDASVDPRFCDNPLVTGAPGIRFYAGAPLVTGTGSALGTLCLVDYQPRAFDEGDRRRLAALARQVMAMLELHRTAMELEQARQAETSNLALYRELFENMMYGVLIGVPETGRIEAANQRAAELMGCTLDQLIGLKREELFDAQDPRLPTLVARRVEQGRARGETRMRRVNGELFEAELSSALFRNASGQLRSSITFHDVTERSLWSARLQKQVELLRNLGDHVPGVIYQYRLFPDGRSCFPYASKGMWRIYEVIPESVQGDATEVFNRLHPDDLPAVAESIKASADALTPWSSDYRVILPGQGERWVRGSAAPEKLEDGSILWHGYIQDVTERKQVEAETHRLAYFDGLTRLPNRLLLHDRITQALLTAHRKHQYGAVMFADLDNFKQINDALGHAIGDELLQLTAKRLHGLLRAEDTVARIGGDEFVVVLGDLGGTEEQAARAAGYVAEKMRTASELPFQIRARDYSISVSIGVALFHGEDHTVDDLLRQADTAMYRAKAAGRNRISFFVPSMQAEVEARLRLENDLKQAVAMDALDVFVQGQVDRTGRTVAGEFLLRWNHPQRGAVPLSQIIPIAEETGLILKIGERVLEKACATLARMATSHPSLSLSVNVSVRQFRSEDFVDRVTEIVKASQAPAYRLVLEVTESLFIDDWDRTLHRMRALAELGIRFSIDDFGTGYSSLAYLQRMPLSEIKIDSSFVRRIPHHDGDKIIAGTILSMAKNLKLEVVAEGVETESQAAYLLALQCDRLQGYLYSRPEPLEAWLAKLDGC